MGLIGAYSESPNRAYTEKANMAAQRDALHVQADQRYAQFLESGKSIPWEEARTYPKNRLAGKAVKRPTGRIG